MLSHPKVCPDGPPDADMKKEVVHTRVEPIPGKALGESWNDPHRIGDLKGERIIKGTRNRRKETVGVGGCRETAKTKKTKTGEIR